MWNKPWKMKEGFVIGAGLLFVGLLLQIAVGPLDWSLFAWPVNIIALAVILALIGTMYALRKKVHVFEWMMHYGAAVPSLVYALGLTIVMGFVYQTDGEEGIPWLSRMLNFWPFVLAWTWMMLIAGLTALNHLVHFKVKEIPFLLNHVGVFMAIVCATLGSADTRELTMTCYTDIPEWRAADDKGEMQKMDLAIELHKFIMDTYEDGTPKRFASEISVYTKDGGNVSGTVDVNKPIKVNGWKIYQYGYDYKRGAESLYSEFLLVHDPWLPWIYAGIFMMLAGALCLMLFMAPKPVKKEEAQ